MHQLPGPPGEPVLPADNDKGQSEGDQNDSCEETGARKLADLLYCQPGSLEYGQVDQIQGDGQREVEPIVERAEALKCERRCESEEIGPPAACKCTVQKEQRHWHPVGRRQVKVTQVTKSVGWEGEDNTRKDPGNHT